LGILETIASNGGQLMRNNIKEADYTFQAGYDATLELLNSCPEFTALICGNDYLALGAISALRERGLEVPKSISVIGFNNSDFSPFINPPLTTVSFPSVEIGMQAAELLINLSRKKITTKDDSTQEPNFWIETFPCLRLTNSLPQGWDSDIKADRFGFTSVPIKLKVKGVIKTYRLQSDAKLFNDDGSYTGFKIECAGNKVTPIKESFNREKKNLIEQAEVDFGTDNGGGSTPPPPPPPRRNRYRTCTGTYTKGCKTDPTGPIGVVQGCLGGLVVDGRFWDKTQNALIAKGYTNGFTDADIPKICGKTNDQEISGESPSEIDPSNTDF
jgi:hypothetical protein